MSLRNLLLLISISAIFVACNSKGSDKPNKDNANPSDTISAVDTTLIDTMAMDTISMDSASSEIVEETAPKTPVVEKPTSPITPPKTMSHHESPEQAKIDSIKAAKAKMKK